MQVDWTPLRHILARYRSADQKLSIWWRDDDAIEPTKALETLNALATRLHLPVHIAVIPGRAHPALAQMMQAQETMIPLVHGWIHRNTAPDTEKKSEFGTTRPDAVADIKRAKVQMDRLFGDRYLDVFVPPWNRIDPALLIPLQRCGFRAVSTFTPRIRAHAAPGILQINTHIDPIDWRGTRGLKDPNALVAQTVDILAARLQGDHDATEPLGYLTHHLVHTSDVWAFSDQLLSELMTGGATARPLAPLLEEHP